MAQEIIKSEFPIAVLELSLHRGSEASRRSGGGGVVRCKIQVDGQTRETLEMDGASEIGLPGGPQAEKHTYGEPEMRLPGRFVATLRNVLWDVIESGRPLWLQLGYPYGTLPVVPWERLLADVAPWPVLRMPYHVTRPEVSSGALDVVLVATSPDPERRFAVEDVVQHHVDEIFRSAPVATHVDVFCDLPTVEGLRRRATLDSRVALHDPQDAPRYREGKDPSDAPEAWFPWISRALGGRSADVLHFVAHGYVGSNQGMLVLADAPEDPRGAADADVIGVRAIHALSQQIGAWCTMLTAPPTNYSILGHRLLADALTRQRPGPVCLYDVRDRPVPGLLAHSYGFLCGYTTEPPRSPDLMLYVHPARTGTPEQLANASQDIMGPWQPLENEYSAAGSAAGAGLRSGRGAPQWLASYQRGLEQTGSELRMVRPKRSQPSSADRGKEEALRFLATTVRNHLEKGGEPK